MSKTSILDAKLKLAESAFNFLEKSVDEIENHPKYSVVHFATAVELLLKSRLMNEHWSLVVERTSDADLGDFLAGKCRTVSPAEAIRRLIKISGEQISKDAISQFEKIAAHRNRMIHFFHEAGAEKADAALVEEVVREQCLAWFYLERLLHLQWAEQFARFENEIARARWLMRRNRSYLKVAYERLSARIVEDMKKGVVFRACSGCGFEAAETKELSEILFEQSCRVCALAEAYVEIECPSECGDKLHIRAEHGSDRTCSKCGYNVTADDLAAILDNSYVDPIDHVQTNCALCSSAGSVVQHNETHVCTECLATDEEIAICDWCSERQMGGGDLEYSYYSGCEFCDGHGGWDRDD